MSVKKCPQYATAKREALALGQTRVLRGTSKRLKRLQSAPGRRPYLLVEGVDSVHGGPAAPPRNDVPPLFAPAAQDVYSSEGWHNMSVARS